MINTERVKAVLSTLSSKDADELEQFLPIIKNAISVVSNLVLDDAHGDEQAEYLAAAKANYDICLIADCDGVTSFSAGNVSFSKTAQSTISAKQFLDEAMKNASSIINDNSFAFLGV